MNRRRLGDDDDPGGELVEAADERRPLRSRPVARMPQQGVQQRAGRVLVGGMHHHAGRLVEREQVIVLEEDVEPDVFGRHLAPARLALRRERDRHQIAERGARGDAADRRAVHGHQSVRDPRLDARAGRGVDVGEMPAEHEVEPPPGVAAIGGEDAGRSHDLSYSGAQTGTTTINAELAEPQSEELTNTGREHEGHERPYR